MIETLQIASATDTPYLGVDNLTLDGRRPETIAEVEDIEPWLRFAIGAETLKAGHLVVTPALEDVHKRMDDLRDHAFELRHGAR